jgi:hypothetical protein
MPTGSKKAGGVRIAPRRPTNPNPIEEAGDDNQDPEDDDAEEHNNSQNQTPIDMASIDLVSLQKEFSKMQKQVSEMVKYMSATKQRVSNEKAASGPASTTSSTTDETPYYHDEYLNRQTAVVRNASEEAQHVPLSRHTSSAWKSKIVKYDKILQVPDRNHINTYLCIARLLLHFYERIQDTQERHAVDEAIELVLDFFADIQARLQYPSSPDIASKISVCVRASRRLRSTGLGSIQGIPSAAPELTDMITCLEKLAEESFVPFTRKEPRPPGRRRPMTLVSNARPSVTRLGP